MPEVEEFDERTVAILKHKGYEIKKSISSGSFGQVYKAKNINTGEYFAVKVMNLEKCSKEFRKEFLPREMAAMMEVNHKNIIQLYDIFKSNKRIFIFMEFAGNGDLGDYLHKNGAIPEEKAYVWFSQVSDGLNYLHTEGHIAHRDIKLENILLNEKNIAKLTDFGFAKESYDQEKGEVILSETYCGTEPYFCPQIVEKVEYDPFMADCWAMGVLLFAMICNKFPFHFDEKTGPNGMLKEQTNRKFLEKRYNKKFSKHIRDLIQKLLEPNEKKRLSVNNVIKHKWIQEKGKCRCE